MSLHRAQWAEDQLDHCLLGKEARASLVLLGLGSRVSRKLSWNKDPPFLQKYPYSPDCMMPLF